MEVLDKTLAPVRIGNRLYQAIEQVAHDNATPKAVIIREILENHFLGPEISIPILGEIVPDEELGMVVQFNDAGKAYIQLRKGIGK